MKLRLFLIASFLIALAPALLLGQGTSSPSYRNARVATGDDMGGLIGDLSRVLDEAMDEEEKAPKPQSRPRIVATRPVAQLITVPSAARTIPMPKAGSVPSGPASSKVSPVAMTGQVENQIFYLINRQRAAQGLAPLAWNEEAARIARMHSQNMANYKFFSHRGLDGKMVNDRADSIGLTKWRSIGENIAFERGYDNPAEFAVRKWMESTSHRENLLGSTWKDSGVGIAVAPDGSYYFTQVFLLKR